MKIRLKQILLTATAVLGGFFVWLAAASAAEASVVFTEIMYNPSGTDTKMEWVEIFNSGPSDVTLLEGSGNDSWRFNDGSNHTLTLAQGSLTIPAGGYAILASDGTTFLDTHAGYGGTVIDTVMSLNNTSDTIQLSSDKGESFFGLVAYENTQGADGDGNSLQVLGGAWIAAAETPGSGAAAQTQEELQETQEQPGGSSGSTSGGGSSSSESEASAAHGDPSKVKISEIFPNPEGDENNEFIELWNNQDQSISLEGWKIADPSKIKTLAGITLVPGEYYALNRSATGIALNNGSETIYLYDANGNLIDTHSYQSTIEGYSLSYDIAKGAFLWSGAKTPSQANSITTPNEPPIPTITFKHNPVAPREQAYISGLDSTDPDDDKLSYFWTIGKSFQASGPTFSYAFDELGEHLVYLTVSDGQHGVAATATIDVLDAVDVVSLRSAQNSQTAGSFAARGGEDAQTAQAATTTGQIFITEIFPNPAGTDDAEWIELYNPNAFGIILDNWTVDDEDGGSRPYTIKGRTIGAQSYLALGKEETALTLNNTSDEARLFDASNTLIDSVRYDDAIEAQSYAKTDDELWLWTANATPGEPNTGGRDALVGADAFRQSVSAPSGIEAAIPYDVVDIDLSNIRELELATRVRVQGTVAVPPGVLAKTYFYITGSPGIQVYFSKRDWPKLALGDVIGVIGELTETGGEMRLKVTAKEDIVALYKSEPPVPQETPTGDIAESVEGALVVLTGELVEKKGTSWFIDDGSGEAKITFQATAALQKPAAKTGDWLEVVGLVGETSSGYRILPRYQEDIKLLDATEIFELAEPQILGVEAEPIDGISRFRIPANEGPQKLLVYLLITSGAAIAILVILIARMRSEMQKRLAELEKKR
ncbi:MAG: lamin tail domain-containing protein [Parcubacteria group bacterium]|nr:lamin tail domain-containing protein [Parcubacteria group bacterium]